MVLRLWDLARPHIDLSLRWELLQVGSMLGVSTVSTFAESTAGVADGAKTGLASLVTGSCFLLAIPFSPVVSAAA